MPMPTRKRNVYDILGRQQINDLLELALDGIEARQHALAAETDYTQEDIDGINAMIERGQEVIDLISADLAPQHARPAALAQLRVLDVRSWVEDEAPVYGAENIIATARGVLGVLKEDGGWHSGEFEKALVNAFFQADTGNLARLTLSFPVHAAVISIYRVQGADGLRALLPEKIQ